MGLAVAGGGLTSNPAVGQQLDGRLSVFARGTNGAVFERHQQAPNSGWQEWAALGGEIIGDPVAATAPDRRVSVFARGNDQQHLGRLDLAGR
ncbi:MAG: hypothetical protein ABIV47_16100 [Roseiflexaceae bacterium]